MILIGALFCVVSFVTGIVVYAFGENLSCSLWLLFASLYAGAYALFIFFVYCLLVRPWEKAQASQLSHPEADEEMVKTVSPVDLNEQHYDRLTLVLAVKYFAKFGAFFSMAACVAFIVFSTVSEGEVEGLMVSGKLNLTSHYYSAMACFLTAVWGFVLWDAANVYWRSYRSVYFDLADQPGDRESSSLLAAVTTRSRDE